MLPCLITRQFCNEICIALWRNSLEPGLLVGLADWYNDYLSHPDDGPFWWQWNIGYRHHEIETPIVHLGGWFDIFLKGTLNNFTGIRARARTAEAAHLLHSPTCKPKRPRWLCCKSPSPASWR